MGVYIIAEAGVNHNGDINIAKKLVDVAVDAGANAVKFQMFSADKLVVPGAVLAEYQKKNVEALESQRNMLRKLELGKDDHVVLKKYCEEKGIDFMSSPFDIDSMRFLVSIGMNIIKIPSGEITNYPYLREAARCNRRIILSTGMCTVEEIRDAVAVLKQYSELIMTNAENLTLLQCNTQYPTPYEDVNLNAMKMLSEEFGYAVGYSDHTIGIEIPIAAVAMGATVIEKHFTLDKNMPGPDHKASIEPNELIKMVLAIRHTETALGDGIKQVTESEKENINIVRKSIVASKDIKKGTVFSEDNITTKRVGHGINPMKWKDIIGTVADRDYVEDECIAVL